MVGKGEDGAYEACESQAGLEELIGLLAKDSRSARGSDEHQGAMQFHPALLCVSGGSFVKYRVLLTTGFVDKGPKDKTVLVRRSFVHDDSIGLTLRLSNSGTRMQEQ